MSMVSTPPWPRATGASLLLVPLGITPRVWDGAVPRLEETARRHGVGAHRGVDVCAKEVREGVLALRGIEPSDVIAFQCPIDIGVWEAVPLCAPQEWPELREYVRSFFRDVTIVALDAAPRVAWVVAHEWLAADRVRWEGGTVESLLDYVTDVDAWRTTFLGRGVGEVWQGDDWPFWYEVSRS
jgi:hypothetical protein